jgi:hypothetical protein
MKKNYEFTLEKEILFEIETPFDRYLRRRIQQEIESRMNKPKYIILAGTIHSTSETGHAITIGQFREIIDYAEAAGTLWNPTNPLLLLSALNPQYTAANNSQAAVNTAKGVYGPAAEQRAIAYKGVDALALGAKGLFYSSGVTKQAKTGIEAVYRKLTGARKTPKVKNPPPDSPKNISVSQLSFTNVLNTFDSFISILEGNPLYAPNEAEFTTVALRIVYNNMKTKNDAVKAAIIPYNTAMDARNKLLYKDEVGVCDTITKLMKPYFLGIYTSNKPMYKKINHIRIKKLKYEE